MKHVENWREFNLVNEQLFGNIGGGIMKLLGMESGSLDNPEGSPVAGDLVIKDLSGEKKENVKILIERMNAHGITNPLSQIGILACIGKESGFMPKNEIMDYSKERLPEIWGVFSKTGKRVTKGAGKSNYNEKAAKFAGNPEKLANYVYGCECVDGMRAKKDSYGNNEKGDGWKYRGRGFNQITFKSAYEKYNNLIKKHAKLSSVKSVDLVTNPDSLNKPEIAAEVAILFFMTAIPVILKNHSAAYKNASDINAFEDQEIALKAMVHANAGIGQPMSYIEGNVFQGLKNSRKYVKSFDIDESGAKLA